ncbi:hypothetical protein [Streptosporangium carneum]|uniref:Uncharacterized protein n=1 Tax=Streptosporangium carneum TaxID=47481 RepID=A0A9W6HWZ1_9ACTN|nr:hypothetical protein [Streptosporangium carneum]GLK07326.1 hypothetical protein GCM10017600_07310 [Streptosporangium carneum]
MPNVLTSIARTIASKLVGGLIGAGAALGVVVPTDLSEQTTVAVSGAVFFVVQVVYYVVARWVERRYPWLGQLLLWSKFQPVYQEARTVRATEAARPLP